MTKTVEYRVRAITRYIVTRHELEESEIDGGTAGSTRTMGEFDSPTLALAIGTALADQERKIIGAPDAPATPTLVTFHGVEHKVGAVMRAKVVLADRRQNVQLMWGGDAKGRTEPRLNDQGREYIWVDPTDPANYRMDGESLTFGAVWGGAAADGKNACLENRIFGDATPSFNLHAHVRNPGALVGLEKGAEYYVDFIPAPKAEG